MYVYTRAHIWLYKHLWNVSIIRCEEIINAKTEPGKFAEDLIFALVAIVFAGMMSGLTVSPFIHVVDTL